MAMRVFVPIASFVLGGFGLAACGSVTPKGEDAGTVGVDGRSADSAVDSPVPPPPCVPPPSHPLTTTDITLFADADGHTGTDNTCPKTGVSFTSSNPQHVWCRRLGGEVRDSANNYNHWWIWTELDQPVGAVGWISAYYIEGQGNDQANGIPECPP